MGKEDVGHIYNGILATKKKKNETRSFIKVWVDLETVIQSKVSQKEKNEYYKSTVQINCTWSA